jgi:hypothetical protein
MIFLIQYDRQKGRLVSIRDFADSEMTLAQNARIELEVSLNRANTDHEVVLLQAQSREALSQTHNRYFADLRQLIEDFASSTSAFVVRERKD